MYLLDTDVVSASRRPDRAPGVLKWMSNIPDEQLFMSAVSFGELARGLVRQESVNPRFADILRFWVEMTEKARSCWALAKKGIMNRSMWLQQAFKFIKTTV